MLRFFSAILFLISTASFSEFVLLKINEEEQAAIDEIHKEITTENRKRFAYGSEKTFAFVDFTSEVVGTDDQLRIRIRPRTTLYFYISKKASGIYPKSYHNSDGALFKVALLEYQALDFYQGTLQIEIPLNIGPLMPGLEDLAEKGFTRTTHLSVYTQLNPDTLEIFLNYKVSSTPTVHLGKGFRTHTWRDFVVLDPIAISAENLIENYEKAEQKYLQ